MSREYKLKKRKKNKKGKDAKKDIAKNIKIRKSFNLHLCSNVCFRNVLVMYASLHWSG